VHDEELREAGHERAEEKERPDLVEVELAAGDDRGRRDDGERDDCDHGRAGVDVRHPRQGAAHGDVHRPEGEPGETGEHDGRHEVRPARPPAVAVGPRASR
jgi:hypothetical protein